MIEDQTDRNKPCIFILHNADGLLSGWFLTASDSMYFNGKWNADQENSQRDHIYADNDPEQLLECQPGIDHQRCAAFCHNDLRKNAGHNHETAPETDMPPVDQVQDQSACSQSCKGTSCTFQYSAQNKKSKAAGDDLNKDAAHSNKIPYNNRYVAAQFPYQKSHRDGTADRHPAGCRVQDAIGTFRNMKVIHNGGLHWQEFITAEASQDHTGEDCKDHQSDLFFCVFRLLRVNRSGIYLCCICLAHYSFLILKKCKLIVCLLSEKG